MTGTLLIALILLIDQMNVCSAKEDGLRVLISSHTNVAVDRILLGLKDRGFESFMRLGSLKKIDKAILKHSIHSGSSSSSDTMMQLKEMLKDATSTQDRKLIQSEIDLHSKGEERRRRKALLSLPVIGATLAALSDLSCPLFTQPETSPAPPAFQLLILDECSQMTEPHSISPILRSNVKYLIACGDPCQLPPVISPPSQLTVQDRIPSSGLLRPMFARLKDMGHETNLLRTQYRLHPTLSQIPIKHFYSSQLINGITETDRASILGPQFPPLSFCNLSGGNCQKGPGAKSNYNIAEAKIIAKMVSDISLKVDLSQPSTLGVICFYVSQVDAVKREIETVFSGLQLNDNCKPEVMVSTVDSFQGQEKEIIILATTIDKPNSNANIFIADTSRLNVALTRAKRHLIIVGCKEVLKGSSDVWCDLTEKAINLTTDHMNHNIYI